jgi:hypothetical protein
MPREGRILSASLENLSFENPHIRNTRKIRLIENNAKCRYQKIDL